MKPTLEQFLRDCLSAGCLVCILAALVFAPLAFGAVEPWAFSIIAVLAYSALALALARSIVAGEVRELLTPVLAPAVFAVGLVGLQCVRWPAWLLGALSPQSLALHRGAELVGGPATAFAPSLYPHATHEALLLIGAYVALFVATYDWVRERRHVTRLAGAIVATGFAVALLGIAQKLSGTKGIYWLRQPVHGGSIFGPFVSRNQYAAYANVCLFTGLGLLVARGAGAARSLRHWREGMERSVSGRLHQNFVLAFAIGLIGGSVFLSMSRGGILAMLLAFAAVFAALGAASMGRKKGRYVAAGIIAILGWVTYLGWEPVVRRLATLGGSEVHPQAAWRLMMLRDAWRMGWDFPLTGSGAGTFLSVYPLYRTLPTRAVTDSPHNEYMHVFAETGLPGLLALAALIVLFYAIVVRGMRRRRNPFARGYLAAGLGAPVAVTLHSMVDFPMRAPALAATVAVAAALMCRATGLESKSRTRQAGEADETWVVPASRLNALTMEDPAPAGSDSRSGVADGPFLPGSLERWLVAAVLVGLVWLLACDAALDPLRGELEGRLIQRAEQRGVLADQKALAFVEASRRGLAYHSPGDAQLHSELAGYALSAAGASDRVNGLLLTQKAIELRALAGRMEPVNAEHPFWAAVHYAGLGRPDLGWTWAERACQLLPRDPWVRCYLADAFRAYGSPELAARYLQEAERLAEERKVEEVRPLIAEVRQQLAEGPEAP
jgi:O-antigen ligase